MRIIFDRTVWPVWLAAAMLTLTAGLHHGPLDVRLQQWINAGGAHWPQTGLMLSHLGLGVSVLLTVTAIHAHQPRRWAMFTAALLASGLLAQIIKYTLTLPRPLGWLPPEAVIVVGESLHGRALPSGHSAAAFAVLGVVLMGMGRGTWEVPTDRWITAAAAALATTFALAVGWSRVAVGAHWPSDVAAGAALGFACGAWSTRAWITDRLATWSARRVPRRTLALLVAVLAVGLGVEAALIPSMAPGLWLAAGAGLLAALRLLGPPQSDPAMTPDMSTAPTTLGGGSAS